ncbi:WXG100 family type VII secretion target [Streptomyces sp. NBC_01478]|uniref:WXG100 family type VII secretion target n=1 Tax=Streptomyces sp. NBC_01478 TaxID=2903882 RepID=UPI002E2EA9CC|nr:WXG100 family type VII secretion target [Streptomyces sp. NBC_01478]
MTDDQHKADLSRVASQNKFTDLARGVEERPKESGLLAGLVYNPVRAVVESTSQGQAVHDSVHGPSSDRRTNFESRPLNEMVDLVERTNPEDLESSGKALWDARDAIKAAADELSGHIDRVRWAGKSGDAFRKWGSELVTQTQSLSTFAGGAGDQITAAAMGLASVRSAMPARDTQVERKHPATFTAAEKVANKDEYTAAVRVEKDRQEAINQMNRLSSYYVVSKDELAALNSAAPEFTAMPDVGVPDPDPTWRDGSGGSKSGDSQKTRTATVPGHHETLAVATSNSGKHVVSDVVSPVKDVTGHVTPPDVSTHTNIDSVGTLPPTTTVPATVHNPPVMGAPAPGGGQTNAFDNGLGTPMPNGPLGRSISGAGGLKNPTSAQGRTGTSDPRNSSTGRTVGRGPASQMGRATETGRSLAKGTASGAKSSPMGRGVTGGTPRASGAATPRANGGSATGAGRSNGVVGGRPTNGTGNSAKGGSRIPRGNVIGAEETTGSRSVPGRPGQRGVFGAPDAAARSASNASKARGGTGASESVTAVPTERKSAARAERNGMTRGGSGLVRGPGSQGKPGDKERADGASCPDHLVEDEETHLPIQPRRDVPPAVN